MKNLIKDLWLAVSLIIAASAVLLISDLGQRQGNQNEKKHQYPEIAIMQISSTPLLDSHVSGVIDHLQSKGYVAPDKTNIHQFNAQNDLSTGNAIAREIVNGPYKLVITSSTVALQLFAKANQSVGKLHVFGAVTDPYGTGVGITGTEPGQHPPYMAGVGTFQPVHSAFEILRQLNPSVKRVGVVWNPGEQCSTSCLSKAREVCEELGIELVEAIATNTSEVSEAVRSLLSKGVEVIWIGGDTVANASIGMIISLAKQGGIPVITNDPSDTRSGALFGLGANYFTVGQYTAQVAVEILEGKSPAEFRIENVVPEELSLNRELLASLGRSWKITQPIEERLDKQGSGGEAERIPVDFDELARQGIKPTVEMIEKADLFLNVHQKYGGPARIVMITLVENALLEEAEKGVEESLKWSGLKEGEDYVIRKYSAQGEIGQLSQIIDAAVREKPDLIISVTTPAMVAVVSKVTTIPVVFTVASDPFRINVFKDVRHPNVCGVHDNPPVDSLLDMAREYDPGIKAVGTIYDGAQMNSILSVEKLRAAGKTRNIDILEATVSNISELSMATQSLLQRGARAIIISTDNLATTGFSAILRVTQAAGIPIYVTELQMIDEGATGGVGISFFDWGKQSGKLAAKVIAGVPPDRLPIAQTQNPVRVNPKGMPGKAGPQRLMKIRLVHYSETDFAERCHEGLMDGIAKAGLVEGKDYEFRVFNAQGDMSTLSSIMTTVKSDHVDLLMVISTPALQAALRQAGADTKIVFTGVGDAIKAGAGKSETDHLPNVTGITTRSPFDGMARLIRETVPGVKNAGTLFTPAEINSVLYKDWLKEELEKQGIGLVAIPLTSSADLAQAAIQLCGQDIQVVCQIADNMTRPGFALIARKGADNNLPVFVFDSDNMRFGAAVCLARDYYNAGLEAAEKAVRVLHGESPAMIPISNTLSEKLIYNPELAKLYKLKLSEEFLKKASVFTMTN